MNEDRTCDAGGTNLTQPRSLDVHAVRKQLDALRAKHGADTPIGHRCSNLIEQLKQYPILPPGDYRDQLARLIAQSVEDLAERTEVTD
jgi:uridine kinase